MHSIGRALMGNPRLLLLDEPMEGLAPVLVEKLFEVFELVRNDGDFAIIFVEQFMVTSRSTSRRAPSCSTAAGLSMTGNPPRSPPMREKWPRISARPDRGQAPDREAVTTRKNRAHGVFTNTLPPNDC